MTPKTTDSRWHVDADDLEFESADERRAKGELGPDPSPVPGPTEGEKPKGGRRKALSAGAPGEKPGAGGKPQAYDENGRFSSDGGGGGDGGGGDGGGGGEEALPAIDPGVQRLVDEKIAAGVGKNKAVSLDPERDAAVREHAAALLTKAKTLEPGTTQAFKDAVTPFDHGNLEGLNFRVKGQDSLQRKIADDVARKGIAPEEAAAQVNDALRYTAVFTPDEFGTSVTGTMNNLKQQGYDVIKWSNTFGPGNVYQGINAGLKTPGGHQRVELQFHTKQSLAIKEHQHVLYNVRRELDGTSPDADVLDQEMMRLSSSVKIPNGATTVPNFGGG